MLTRPERGSPPGTAGDSCEKSGPPAPRLAGRRSSRTATREGRYCGSEQHRPGFGQRAGHGVAGGAGPEDPRGEQRAPCDPGVVFGVLHDLVPVRAQQAGLRLEDAVFSPALPIVLVHQQNAHLRAPRRPQPAPAAGALAVATVHAWRRATDGTIQNVSAVGLAITISSETIPSRRRREAARSDEHLGLLSAAHERSQGDEEGDAHHGQEHAAADDPASTRTSTKALCAVPMPTLNCRL